jgi:hypothetical protein
MLPRASRFAAQADVLDRGTGRDHQVQIVSFHHLVIVLGGDGPCLLDGRASMLQIAMRHDHQLRSGVILQLPHRAEASVPMVQPNDADAKRF